MLWVQESIVEAGHAARVRQLLLELQAAAAAADEADAEACRRLDALCASDGARRDIFEACERLERLRAFDAELVADEGPLLGWARQLFLSRSPPPYEA